MHILSVKNLSKAFGSLQAVNNLTFDVKEGEILGLIGPNGAGKSTTFNLITGLYKPTEGQVLFNGHDITGLPPQILVAKGIARTFQGTRIFSKLTVLENVMRGRHRQIRKSLRHVLIQRRKMHHEMSVQREQAREILKILGIADKEQEVAGNLAYAHQSLLGMAIALATEPKLVLFDEPIAGMNASESSETMILIRKIQESGITVIMVEHNMKAVMKTCDRIVVLDYGEKLAEGTPNQVRENPKVIEAYLGADSDA